MAPSGHHHMPRLAVTCASVALFSRRAAHLRSLASRRLLPSPLSPLLFLLLSCTLCYARLQPLLRPLLLFFSSLSLPLPFSSFAVPCTPPLTPSPHSFSFSLLSHSSASFYLSSPFLLLSSTFISLSLLFFLILFSCAVESRGASVNHIVPARFTVFPARTTHLSSPFSFFLTLSLLLSLSLLFLSSSFYFFSHFSFSHTFYLL